MRFLARHLHTKEDSVKKHCEEFSTVKEKQNNSLEFVGEAEKQKREAN